MKRAIEVELGDIVGDERVTGWFLDGRGRVMIEHGDGKIRRYELPPGAGPPGTGAGALGV